jgi:hypothetical protein
MKNMTRLTGAAFALLVSISLLPVARAQLSFRYEEAGGGHAIGDAFTGGDFRINLSDFDMGTLYPSLGPTGTSVGFGQGGAAGSVQAGIAALDATQTAGANGALPTLTTINGVPQAGTLGLEDTWGIARITQITDSAGFIIWSEAAKNQQLTIAFYGEKDYYVRQLASGFQQTDGVGLHVDLYLQDKTDPSYTAFNPFLGSAGRLDISHYTNVTDSNGTNSLLGVPILTTISTPGFIHDVGVLGGLAAEFTSNFNQTSVGDGQGYLSVTGGTMATQFNTNGFVSPFGTGNTADLFAQFTTRAILGTPDAVSDWLVSSNDPVRGRLSVAVPEASTTMAGVAGLLLVGATLYRRKKLQAAKKA